MLYQIILNSIPNRSHVPCEPHFEIKAKNKEEAIEIAFKMIKKEFPNRQYRSWKIVSIFEI